MKRAAGLWTIGAALGLAMGTAHAQTAIAPGTRTLMDAHNCYPYAGWWNDRIDRALSAGEPLAIEQDLALATDPKTGKSRPVVSHSAGDLYGNEPTFEHYFFDKVAPLMHEALAHPDRKQWPLITLNLDFKSDDPVLLRAVWQILESRKEWLTTATKTGSPGHPSALRVGPMLVLTGEQDAQQKVFYDPVPAGGTLLLFGAVHTLYDNGPHRVDPMAPVEALETEPVNDYRRWWNNPWDVVEQGGQTKAGAWTAQDNARLRALVEQAHRRGLWIRFYTLDGAPQAALSANGWFAEYDFGSEPAAEERWTAAIADGVDYLASDQYEDVGLMCAGARAEDARAQGEKTR